MLASVCVPSVPPPAAIAAFCLWLAPTDCTCALAIVAGDAAGGVAGTDGAEGVDPDRKPILFNLV